MTRNDQARAIPSRDAGGYADLGAYGVIGDGRGIALVAGDGSIDWWATPRLDTPPAFAAMLDPDRGGCIELRPAERDARVRRRYLPSTNVLEMTFETSTGTVRVTDCLNSGSAGALPWSELARRIEGISGSVRLQWAVRPGDGLGRWQPWAEQAPAGGTILHAGDITLAVRANPEVQFQTNGDGVAGELEVSAGQRHVLGVVAARAEPLFLTDPESIDARLDLTVRGWRRWARQVCWTGPRRPQVVRSALTLKLLMMAHTGAIAAAATTSLPESTGGPKNWDYRFSWIRDAALSIDAMSDCGLQEEVHAAIAWLLGTVKRNGPDVHVMYSLDGDLPTDFEQALVPGYRNSRPVRIGNDAAGQIQLGVYGDLFGTVATWVFGGHVLDTATARQLSDLADRCADLWHHQDAGIWELHTNRAYTSSKMNCWRALDAAARLAEAGHLPGSAQRWRNQAHAIKTWVEKHCWSQTKNAYTFYAGTDDLDASVLLGAGFGFDRGPRMISTIAAIRAELAAGPLLYRYTGAEHEEQTFTACAYWLVQALAHTGQTQAGEQLMHQLDSIANDLGLMSEMATPGAGELLGNLPQALSHLALIGAAAALRDSTEPTTPSGKESP